MSSQYGWYKILGMNRQKPTPSSIKFAAGQDMRPRNKFLFNSYDVRPLAKKIPTIRLMFASVDLAKDVATIGAERGTFGAIAMSSPEIRRYEHSALGSSRII